MLTIHPEDRPDEAILISDPDLIAETLWKVGVLFERWAAQYELSADADQKTIIEAYQDSINRLIDRYEFTSVDVVSLTEDHPDKAQLRSKFLSEHIHEDFEVRYFVEGKGLFYLHVDDRVLVVLCEGGDLISVPANTRHWFDMGEFPRFKCIRLFEKPEGWVARFTEDPIADKFPRMETYLGLYQ